MNIIFLGFLLSVLAAFEKAGKRNLATTSNNLLTFLWAYMYATKQQLHQKKTKQNNNKKLHI